LIRATYQDVLGNTLIIYNLIYKEQFSTQGTRLAILNARRNVMKVAIPNFNDRVSPRFDCAQSVLLIRVENNEVQDQQEIFITDWDPLPDRVSKFLELGIDVLICGGISYRTIEHFENAVQRRCGAGHAIAVSHGTAALHLACLAMGLGAGDHLWTSPNTFVASANCALYCGASVDFVDINSRTWNLDASQLSKKLEYAEKVGRLPKIVVPVHFSGQPCEMEAIWKLSRQYGFYVLEDACHAFGGRYGDRPIGSCGCSDITVFSLHPVKSITSGEGGLILTNNKQLYETMKTMRAHGIVRGGAVEDNTLGPWHVEMQMDGYNYKISSRSQKRIVFNCSL